MNSFFSFIYYLSLCDFISFTAQTLFLHFCFFKGNSTYCLEETYQSRKVPKALFNIPFIQTKNKLKKRLYKLCDQTRTTLNSTNITVFLKNIYFINIIRSHIIIILLDVLCVSSHQQETLKSTNNTIHKNEHTKNFIDTLFVSQKLVFFKNI